MQLQGACSSAGRAPALQVSRLNHITAASGVAYMETRGATTLSNWTDVGPKALTSMWLGRRARRVPSARRNVQAARHHCAMTIACIRSAADPFFAAAV